MEYLLHSVGLKWRKLTCKYALQYCNLIFTKKNKNYWYQTKSRFGRSCYENSVGLNSLNNRLKRSYHNWHGFIKALECFNVNRALSEGWIQTTAKNHYLLWKDEHGRLEWHPKTKHIRIVVSKPFSRGKLLQLLSNAFFETNLILDLEIIYHVL